MEQEKNLGGRPLKFTLEELNELIQAYFEKCDSNTRQFVDKNGNVHNIKEPIPYTIEGLCVHLECTRKTLLNYEKNYSQEDEESVKFLHTIKKAKLKINANKVERGLMGLSPATFAIFDLVNNSDYRNTSDVDITSGGDKININPITWAQ